MNCALSPFLMIYANVLWNINIPVFPFIEVYSMKALCLDCKLLFSENFESE